MATFARDGERWVQDSEIPQVAQAKCLNTIHDWLVLRRAAREEAHILKINNIGIERDEAMKRKNVAKHCGLSMPIEYKHQ